MMETFNNYLSPLANMSAVYNSFGNKNALELPVWSRVTYSILTIMIMILALAGNGTVLTVTNVTKNKTSTDWMVLFMSCNDVVQAAFCIPVYILTVSGYWSTVGSTLLCAVLMFIQETTSFSSTLLLSVTAIDRCIKACRPHVPGITPLRSKRLCLGITILTVIMNWPLLVVYKQDDFLKCKYYPTDDHIALLAVWLMYLIQLSFALMFVLAIVCYCKIAYTLRCKLRQPTETVPTSESRHIRFIKLKRKRVRPACTITTVSGTTETFELKASGSGINKDQVDDYISDSRHNKGKPIFATKTLNSEIQNTPNSDNTRGQTETLTAPSRLRKKTFHSRRVKRTSVIMFAITMVFIVSWIPPWTVSFLWPNGYTTNINDSIVDMFCRNAFIINTCTNPLFFIGMSARFRENAYSILQKIRTRMRT